MAKKKKAKSGFSIPGPLQALADFWTEEVYDGPNEEKDDDEADDDEGEADDDETDDDSDDEPASGLRQDLFRALRKHDPKRAKSPPASKKEGGKAAGEQDDKTEGGEE